MDYTFYGALALVLFCWMLVVQWFIASMSKAKAPGAIPGKINEDLSHDSFVFRAHRTFQNSLENAPLFIATLLFGMQMGISGAVFNIAALVFVIARLIHMVLYYKIATEKNPSPRSHFFMIGWIANVVMLVMVTLAVFW